MAALNKLRSLVLSPLPAMAVALILAAAIVTISARNYTLTASPDTSDTSPIMGPIRPTALPNKQADITPFTFIASADIRKYAGPDEYNSSLYFRGAAEAISLINNAFMVSPGDIDPPVNIQWTITQTLGESYRWYPVVGNHELPGNGTESNLGENINWLKGYDYGIVNEGPPGCPNTTYSFSYGSAHFIMLNEYCDQSGADVTDGDIPDHLYKWLAEDISNTLQSQIFIFGHEPAYPQPDRDNGRVRHLTDSLNQHPANRDRFWNLLQNQGILAYICGHTHNYSIVKLNDVWQIDVGHARGIGDTGARSTFVAIHIEGESVTFNTYRDDANGGAYTLTHSGLLLAANTLYFPLIVH